MPIADFDDRTTRLLCQAFDLACAQLHDADQPYIVRKAIAKRIVEAAKAGETDPICLCNVALAGFAQPTNNNDRSQCFDFKFSSFRAQA
jgi:hypothetical protein